MSERESEPDADGKERQTGAPRSRRAALLAMLTGSNAAYAAPLAASFALGGLSLPAQAGLPPFGNQCFGGNQPLEPRYYRIDVGATYDLEGIPSGRFLPSTLFVELRSIIAADVSGWTARVAVWFGAQGSATVLPLEGEFFLAVSNSGWTFALYPSEITGSIDGAPLRGGGPLVLKRRGIAALTPESPFPAVPIHSAAVTFGAAFSAPTLCGVLRILRVRSLATLSTAGTAVGTVPDGSLPPAIVPSGAL